MCVLTGGKLGWIEVRWMWRRWTGCGMQWRFSKGWRESGEGADREDGFQNTFLVRDLSILTA